MSLFIRYRAIVGPSEWFQVLLQPCLHCKKQGNLCSHGFLRGNSMCGQLRENRGKRVFCSNRGRKSGCGRTFSVLLPDKLRRHTVSTLLLWLFLRFYLFDSRRVRTAWRQAQQSLGARFCDSNGYKIRKRLGRLHSAIRLRLCKILPPPPAQNDANPMTSTLRHLLSIEPHASDPIAAFQSNFQSGFLDAS